jgi:hypothetical protein
MMIARASLLLCCMIALPVVQAQSTIIFASNYDAVLIVNGNKSHVRSRVEVRNGGTFPIQFESHEVRVQISAASDDGYRIELSVLERSGTEWYPVDAEPVSFEGTYSIPFEYKWNSTGVQLDLALVVSPVRR